MNFRQLYEIVKKCWRAASADPIPCSVLADMIEDTEDITPLSPETLACLREADCYDHVSNTYPTITKQNKKTLWEPYYGSSQNSAGLFVFIQRNIAVEGCYLSFSFYAYKNKK